MNAFQSTPEDSCKISRLLSAEHNINIIGLITSMAGLYRDMEWMIFVYGKNGLGENFVPSAEWCRVFFREVKVISMRSKLYKGITPLNLYIITERWQELLPGYSVSLVSVSLFPFLGSLPSASAMFAVDFHFSFHTFWFLFSKWCWKLLCLAAIFSLAGGWTMTLSMTSWLKIWFHIVLWPFL